MEEARTARLRRIAALVGLAALALASGPARADLEGQALTDRIAELETEVAGLRAESKEISGSASPSQGEQFVRNRLYGLKARSDDLDEVIEDVGGTQKELESYRDQLDDAWVVDEGDIAAEAAEKGVEQGVRRGLSMGAGRALGWLGLAIDVGEYGGKWVLKEGDVAALEEAAEQNRVNLMDLYQVSIGLSGEIDRTLADIERMKEIRARHDALVPELVRLRERKAFLETPATRRAVTDRVTDAEGDAEEAARHSAESAERGVSTVGPPVEPLPKGVSPGRTIQPGMQNQAPRVPRGRSGGGKY